MPDGVRGCDSCIWLRLFTNANDRAEPRTVARRGRSHDADAYFGAIGRRRPDVYLREFIMPTKSIVVPDAVYERVQQAATAEGTTVDQLATKAIERDLARRWLERVWREGDLRRGNMSDAEVEAVVERAVQEFRARS